MVENIKTYKILLSGRVQGVGFRYFAESIADKYSVKGYVRNTVNGKVEIVSQGEEEEVRAFIEEVKKGPAFSVITGASLEEIPGNKSYNTFEIKY